MKSRLIRICKVTITTSFDSKTICVPSERILSLCNELTFVPKKQIVLVDGVSETTFYFPGFLLENAIIEISKPYSVLKKRT